MKPLNRPFAAALLLSAALNPAWIPQATAAPALSSTSSPTTANASLSLTQILSAPFDSDMAGLSMPVKYGLLLVGLSLIEKLSRQRRGR